MMFVNVHVYNVQEMPHAVNVNKMNKKFSGRNIHSHVCNVNDFIGD